MTDVISIDLPSTMGSLARQYFPSGWDLAKFDELIESDPSAVFDRQEKWNEDFHVRQAKDLSDFNVMFGHEIASEIKRCRDDGRELALILPVGPMGQYRWAAYFLREWDVSCDHVTAFTMDEWSDAEGNALAGDDQRSFQYAMTTEFFDRLKDHTIPTDQRYFATKEMLPEYPDRIESIRDGGGKLSCVYGIGRPFHIAFWEPQFGEEYDTDEVWRSEPYRIGAELHPMTIEQNAITSFKSRTPRVPAYANTIGPDLFTNADYCIGGADGIHGRGMQWQGMSLWITLRHPTTRHITSSWMPTQPGVLFFIEELAGPLEAEAN